MPLAARAQLADPRVEVTWSYAAYAGSDTFATGFAWAPDGSNRLFATLQDGGAWVVLHPESPQARTTELFAQITPLFAHGESGLVGLAFDPGFQLNHYVYFFVTVSPSEQQIVRYTAQGNRGTDPTVIVRGLPTAGGRHNGGALGVGPDGTLFWGVGDNGEARGVNADLTSLAAKIGRANLDGSLPNDNPFFDGAGRNADFIWARGMRNPFTLTFQPATGALWVNVVGERYEQAFVVERGDHAGYIAYENDQPDGFLTPIIKYRTNESDVRALTAADGAARTAGTVTFSTTTAHGFRRGEKLTIGGVTDASFNGEVYVASTPSATTFTANQAGADAQSGSGSVTTQYLGGSITGGTFYDATLFPPEYRGNFFFGDFNRANVVRAVLSAPATIARVDEWARPIERNHGFVDVETGPDGAIYALYASGELVRLGFKSDAQALVVSNTHVWMPQGSARSVSVSLALAPSAEVVVDVARTGGDPGIAVSAGSTLTFTPDNWSIPQAVTIATAIDDAKVHDVAAIAVSSAGLASESVTVHAVRAAGNALVLSANVLAVAEGASSTFTVALAAQPAANVVVSVARSAGSASVAVAEGATLTFTPASFALPQTVVIEVADDAVAGFDAATISLSAGALAPRAVAVTAIENDPYPPAITSVPKTEAFVGISYSYPVQARGVPSATFELVMAPDGMAIDRSTGEITWLPALEGLFEVAVIASNGVLPGASQPFTLRVTYDYPPGCGINEPAADSVVSGAGATFSTSGSDEEGLWDVELFVDGQVVYRHVDVYGYEWHYVGGAAGRWDTTAYSDGLHTLGIRGTDKLGQVCEQTRVVTVDNEIDGAPDASTAGDAGSAMDAAISDSGPGQPMTSSEGGAAGASGASGASGAAGAAGAAGEPAGAFDAGVHEPAEMDAATGGARADAEADAARETDARPRSGGSASDASSDCSCRAVRSTPARRHAVPLLLIGLALALRRQRASERRKPL